MVTRQSVGILLHLKMRELEKVLVGGWGGVNLTAKKEEILPGSLVDLLTPVHPWLSSRVAAHTPPVPTPVTLALISSTLWNWPNGQLPAPTPVNWPVQGLAVSGAVPATLLHHFCQNCWKISFPTITSTIAGNVLNGLRSPCNGASSAPWACQQVSSQRNGAEPLIIWLQKYSWNFQDINKWIHLWRKSKVRPADAGAVQLPSLSYIPEMNNCCIFNSLLYVLLTMKIGKRYIYLATL